MAHAWAHAKHVYICVSHGCIDTDGLHTTTRSWASAPGRNRPALSSGKVSCGNSFKLLDQLPMAQAAVLVLAALGRFSLWGAVLVDVGTALAVILNGVSLLRWPWPASTHDGVNASAANCCSTTLDTACCKAGMQKTQSDEICSISESTHTLHDQANALLSEKHKCRSTNSGIAMVGACRAVEPHSPGCAGKDTNQTCRPSSCEGTDKEHTRGPDQPCSTIHSLGIDNTSTGAICCRQAPNPGNGPVDVLRSPLGGKLHHHSCCGSAEHAPQATSAS